jgi:hypothetical protein
MNKRSLPAYALCVLCALCAFTVTLLFPGCELYGKVGGDDANIEGALPYLLQGEWAYIPTASGAPGDGYVITNNTIEYVYHGAGSSIGADFKGKVVFVSNYSPDSGLIIMQYTDPPTYPGYNGNAFCATYYRNLRAGSVQLANTTTFPAYTCPDTATLEEAKIKFTRVTMGNYVSWTVTQPQTRIR